MSKIQPVVLSGGAGTRLWPVSRAHYPKQLLPLMSERTMVQETLLRLRDGEEAAARFAAPVVVCNEAHRFTIAEQMQEIRVTPAAHVLEPVGRNTAPAATIAALIAHEEHPATPLLILPADHFIRDIKAFLSAVDVAHQQAQAGRLVTFGIRPEGPETGYGYIRQGQPVVPDQVFTVAEFVEKPDAATAERYLADGGYHWNSGMFLFRADIWLEQMERHCPDILARCREALDHSVEDLDFLRLPAEVFAKVRSDSIDYAVMEHTREAVVVPVDIGWSDIGSWAALWAASERDESDNHVVGDVLLQDARGCYVRADHRLVAAVGIEDLVIVEAADVVMVAPRRKAEEVKALVDRLKQEGRSEHLAHRRVHRPWGYYESIEAGARHQVKHLCVKPGAKLSLQKHAHRAEHWVVVRGLARVTIGEETRLMGENESAYIPVGAKHRLENAGEEPLSIIEVQTGSYLGEDDIVRYEDDYRRHL